MVGNDPLQIHILLCASLVAFALCLSPNLVSARTVVIKVTDQQGQPLSDAVVLVPGARPAAVAAEPAVMDQINKQFQPHVLTIAQGRSVSFPNSDNIRHHVYSFSKPNVFELKLYAKQPEAPVMFDTPGIVVLGCNIHDSMVGYIVVSDSGIWGQTDAEGVTTLELADSVDELRVWHPQQQGDVATTASVPYRHPLGSDRFVLQLSVNPKPEPEAAEGFKNKRFKRYGS